MTIKDNICKLIPEWDQLTKNEQLAAVRDLKALLAEEEVVLEPLASEEASDAEFASQQEREISALVQKHDAERLAREAMKAQKVIETEAAAKKATADAEVKKALAEAETKKATADAEARKAAVDAAAKKATADAEALLLWQMFQVHVQDEPETEEEDLEPEPEEDALEPESILINEDDLEEEDSEPVIFIDEDDLEEEDPEPEPSIIVEDDLDEALRADWRESEGEPLIPDEVWDYSDIVSEVPPKKNILTKAFKLVEGAVDAFDAATSKKK